MRASTPSSDKEKLFQSRYVSTTSLLLRYLGFAWIMERQLLTALVKVCNVFTALPPDANATSCWLSRTKVRWADLEEQKDADRKRAIGFVVGQTDWERITDESGQLAQRALNRTKYF